MKPKMMWTTDPGVLTAKDDGIKGEVVRETGQRMNVLLHTMRVTTNAIGDGLRSSTERIQEEQ